MNKKNNEDDESYSSGDSAAAFAFVDFSGVDFGGNTDDDNIVEENKGNTKKTSMDTGTNPLELIPGMERSSIGVERHEEQDQEKATEVANVADDVDVAIDSSFASVQEQQIPLRTVSFEKVHADTDAEMSDIDKTAVSIEDSILSNDCYIPTTSDTNDSTIKESETKTSHNESIQRIRTMAKQLAEGSYVSILSGPTSHSLSLMETPMNTTSSTSTTVARRIRTSVIQYCTDTTRCVEAELFAVAAFNLFLQVNYTGPSFHDEGLVRPGHEGGIGNGEEGKLSAREARARLERVNPHRAFVEQLGVSSSLVSVPTTEEEEKEGKEKETVVDAPYQNGVLAELAVDGEWPCPVCKYPYFLLLARSILSTLADPNRPDWSFSIGGTGGSGDKAKFSDAALEAFPPPTPQFVRLCRNLSWSDLYSARAALAHYRLLQVEEISTTLWREVEETFQRCVTAHCTGNNDEENPLAARIMLELGLAEHHFDVNKKGKLSFQKALRFAGLMVEVTGSEGVRTKYQKKATAQMLVRAKPTTVTTDAGTKVVPTAASTERQADEADTNKATDPKTNKVEAQMVQHDEETILLNKVRYSSEDDNVHHQLSILHQSVLLALCLDVKNDNPMDGLTAEQMGAFLERVLQQHDDWMLYATALLERAWLESERNHTRQRAILQIQALADQHTNRLTLTQSTFQAAVEDSAPPQERLRNLHKIVYPPRWYVLRDLAERYAKMGIVTTAAEMFEEIERWDDVVECYRRAGKEDRAEEIIRKRLEVAETPRMWAALGDIKNDPEYYEKALHISNGKYAGAYVALGKFHSDAGDLVKATRYFKEAVRLKPLSAHVWFRLGAISMKLENWELGLQAFSEVVQQEPEEGDAWANVAAIHMHNKNPAEAYPALVESLKLNRDNWRVWASKLWTCMDLKKYDEAIQACIILIDMRTNRNASENIPPPEERVVRAIVGGTISQYQKALKNGDDSALESGKRTISRVRELLSKVKSSVKNEPWVFETCAYFNEQVGRTDQVVEDLMKEYRALQNIAGWETDSVALPRICLVLSQLLDLHIEEEKLDSLKKFKFLVNGTVRRVRAAYFDLDRLPSGIRDLETILKNTETKISQI